MTCATFEPALSHIYLDSQLRLANDTDKNTKMTTRSKSKAVSQVTTKNENWYQRVMNTHEHPSMNTSIIESYFQI
jgi:hypothetical protein